MRSGQIFNRTCFFYEFILWVTQFSVPRLSATTSGINFILPSSSTTPIWIQPSLSASSQTLISIIDALSFIIAIIAAYLVRRLAAASDSGLPSNVNQASMGSSEQ